MNPILLAMSSQQSVTFTPALTPWSQEFRQTLLLQNQGQTLMLFLLHIPTLHVKPVNYSLRR